MAKDFWEKLKPLSFSFLLLIIFVSIFLRVYGLSRYPVGFHSQEALLGWRAQSILLTGKDETGRFLPLIFSSLEGYQLPFSTYLLIPSVKILGLNEIAVRLTFALFGILAIVSLFGIIRLLLPQEKKLALWATFFFAINPWSLWQSRIASASHLSLSLFLIGFFFLLLAMKKNWSLPISIIFLAFSLYTAKLVWFFIFLFLLILWFFKRKKEILITFFTLIILLAPLLFLYNKVPQAKLDFLKHDLTLFSDTTITSKIDMMRGEDIQVGYPFFGKIFYNKTFYIEKLAENFLRHFNPRFYFASGDSNPLHGLTNFGPILFVFLPFTLMGVWLMFKKEKNFFYFLFFWFLVGIIPSVLSLPSPDEEKSIFVLPVLAILSAYALAKLKKIYLVAFWFLLIVNVSIVCFDAMIKEPLRVQEKWQYGYKNLAIFLNRNLEGCKKIFLTDSYGSDPGPLLLFYFNYSPEKFIQNNQEDFGYRYWIKQVDKITIDQTDSWEPNEFNLFVMVPEEKELLSKLGNPDKREAIRDLNSEPLFLIFSWCKEYEK